MDAFTATTTSNHFRVKDGGLFRFWCDQRGLGFTIKTVEPDQVLYAITADQRVTTGWPTYIAEAGGDFDIAQELAPHLDGDVAVLFESAGVRGRYAMGSAKAVNPDGRVVTLHLTDIYDRARDAFSADI